MSINERISELTLVASDLVYNKNAVPGQSLTVFPDSGGVPSWYGMPRTFDSANFVGLTVAVAPINISTTGFGVVILQNTGTSGTDPEVSPHLLSRMCGTRGLCGQQRWGEPRL